MEMAVLAKDGIEVRTLLRVKPTAIEPTEPMYELEKTGETEAEKRKRDIQNQEKKVNSESQTTRVPERGPICNNFPWEKADTKVRNYIFLGLGTDGQKQLQQKRPGLELHTISTS